MSSGTTNEDMVQAFTPNRPNQLLSKRVLPGTPCRSNDLFHSQQLDAPAKLVTADRVPITDQAARQRRVAGCVVHREVHRHLQRVGTCGRASDGCGRSPWRRVDGLESGRGQVVGVRKPRCFQSTGFVAGLHGNDAATDRAGNGCRRRDGRRDAPSSASLPTP